MATIKFKRARAPEKRQRIEAHQSTRKLLHLHPAFLCYVVIFIATILHNASDLCIPNTMC
jgi:hypothetical protein